MYMYSEVSYVHPVFVSKNNSEEIQCLNSCLIWLAIRAWTVRYGNAINNGTTEIDAHFRIIARACVRACVSTRAWARMSRVRVLKYVYACISLCCEKVM